MTFITAGNATRVYALDGFEVIQIGLRDWSSTRMKFLEFYLKVSSRIPGVRADLYQAEDLFSLPLAWFGSWLHGARLSYDCRELYFALGSLAGRRWTQAFWKIVERLWIRKAGMVMVTAENQREVLASRYGISPPIVVRNHPPLISRHDKSRKMRETFKIPGDCRILLYQGMLHPGRGIFLPLEIVRRVDGCVVVYLAFGELKDDLLRKVEEYGLRGKVFIHGPTPYTELLEYTSGADVGLALQEPFGENHLRARPNKIFEYIMAGVPVVASDFPPLRKAIVEKGIGLVVDVEDMDDVVEKVRMLLTDEGLYESMVRNCATASGEFNWEADEAGMLSATSTLLGEGG